MTDGACTVILGGDLWPVHPSRLRQKERPLTEPRTTLATRHSLWGALTILAAVAYLGLAAIQIPHGPFDDQLTTTIDYLNDGAFAAGLLLSVVGILALGAATAAPRAAIVLAALGQLLVFSGVVAGLASGESPSWFAAVGVPGNLLALIGMTMLAWHVWRTRALPAWLAVLMVLAVPVGVGVAEFGGSIVPGLVWLVIGGRLLRERPRPTHSLQPGTAPLASS